MMDPLGIARDLGADHARGLGLLLRAPHPADTAALDYLDVERARRRTIVRAGGMADVDFGVLVHAVKGNIKCFGRRRTFARERKNLFVSGG